MADRDQTDLELLRDRLSTILMDTRHTSWDADTLDEALRLALVNISQAAGTALTVQGLAGGDETTLTEADQGALITGAAGYAGRARALDLAEKVSAGPNAQAALAEFARTQMELFQEQLGQIQQRTLHTAAGAPYQALLWDEH